jgi:hypothetical protein
VIRNGRPFKGKVPAARQPHISTWYRTCVGKQHAKVTPLGIFASFPYFGKIKKGFYKIRLLSVCVRLCFCASPLSLLGNGSVKVPLSLLSNIIPQNLLDSIFSKLLLFIRQWEKEKSVPYPVEISPPLTGQLSCCHNGKGTACKIYEKLTEITRTLLLLPC